MLTTILQSKKWQAFSVSLLAFLVYMKTLAPTVTFIDSGELAAVACILGVAHPTGYPLFTLLGWVFSKLPIGSEEIVRLNIMAAFLCAAGLYVFYFVIHHILTLVSIHPSIQELKVLQEQTIGISMASAGATLLLGFSETYWSQATSIEVYSLHALFLSLVGFCFLKAVHDKDSLTESQRENDRLPRSAWWFLFAFALGLSFTNHMTTILLAPGLLFLYFATQGSTIDSWKRIAILGIPFSIGLSVYLYLPVRAAQSPALNWGNTVTLERFLWHFSGKQYRVWIFSSTEAAARQLKYFATSLPSEFAYIGLILALLGCILLWRTNKKLFVGIMLLFWTCVLYSINYDIHDIDSYFLLAYFCVALWAGCGLLQIYVWLRNAAMLKLRALFAVMVLVGLSPFFLHYKSNDESKNYLVEDYTMNLFNSLKPNALVFSYQWDYWLSASYYYQLVKGVRPDVVVVDKELLRRSWYLAELENRFPWLINDSRTEVEAFKRELYKFEHDLSYNPNIIQARFVEMIASFIRRELASKPVYVTHEIEPEFTQGLQRVPEGLAFRLLVDTTFYTPDFPSYFYRDFGRRGRLGDMVKTLYAGSLIARARFYYNGRSDYLEAQKSLQLALVYDPSSIEARNLLTALQSGAKR